MHDGEFFPFQLPCLIGHIVIYHIPVIQHKQGNAFLPPFPYHCGSSQKPSPLFSAASAGLKSIVGVAGIENHKGWHFFTFQLKDLGSYSHKYHAYDNEHRNDPDHKEEF